jgi:hypothetical protein
MIAEQALIRNRGRRFLICEIRALNHADILRLEKRSTVLFCALKRETRLDQFQLARALSEKYQNNFLLTTQNRSLVGKWRCRHAGILLWPGRGDGQPKSMAEHVLASSEARIAIGPRSFSVQADS